MTSFAERCNRVALAAAAAALSARAAFSTAGSGDYHGDARRAIADLLHGNFAALAGSHPAMGPLSVLVRTPFAALDYIGHPSELGIYRWGALACTLSLAVLALWLAALARARGTRPLGQWLIVLVALVNPLVKNAVELGHPEELMTGALCVGALVAACELRRVLTIVLLGLALACKQWALVTVLPVLLTLERGRIRALLTSLALAVFVTLPMMAGAPLAYLRDQLSMTAGAKYGSTPWTWWWPPAPAVSQHVLVEGVLRRTSNHALPVVLGKAVRLIVVSAAMLVAAVVGWLRELPLRRDDAFALMSLVLLLRCTLDTDTEPYYHVPLLIALLAWDALSGERLPLRALSGAALAFALFDRLTPSEIGAAPASLVYGGATLVVALLLARSLLRRSGSARRRVDLRRPLPA